MACRRSENSMHRERRTKNSTDVAGSDAVARDRGRLHCHDEVHGGVSSDQLRLSVLIPTYNRAETFRETLRHLAEQDLDPAAYEVVVIDDGSTERNRAVAEEWRLLAPFRLRYTYQTNHGPGHAYNRALEAAEAPVVLYLGDDMLLPRQSLKAHLEMHETHPE